MTTLTYSGPMPVNFPLPDMVVGQDYPFTISFKDDNRAVIDTTSWDMSIALRENNENGAVINTLAVGVEITHTAALGKFAVKIPDTITSLIDVGKIAWDCKVIDANGDITYPLRGTINILQAVTA